MIDLQRLITGHIVTTATAALSGRQTGAEPAAAGEELVPVVAVPGKELSLGKRPFRRQP